jgi:xylose isomerase
MLRDLRGQSKIRGREELVEQLSTFKLNPKFSMGVWYFFPAGGRFHERYVEQGTMEDILNIIRGMKDKGVVDSSFKLEGHFPNEINWDNIDEFKDFERETGIGLVNVGPNIFYEKRYEFGSLSNPNPEVRSHAIARTTDALKLGKEAGAAFMVVWPGIDGYENPFGTDFYGMWNRFESALAQVMDAVPGTRVAIEPKPYEPRGNNIYRNTANGLLMARNAESILRHEENRHLLEQGHAMVCLNPEVGHVMMGHEELAYAFASALREGRLAHTHWNSQPLGNYDQDLNVGVLGIDQMYAALLVMKMHGYSEYFGIDINPERIPIERAIALNVNAIRAACDRLNQIDKTDWSKVVDAITNPQENRGAIEDVMTRSLAPTGSRFVPI